MVTKEVKYHCGGLGLRTNAEPTLKLYAMMMMTTLQGETYILTLTT